MPACQSEYPADVIGMFMGHQNAIQLLRRQPETQQSPRCFAQAESAIDQQAGRTIIDQQTIASTAAAE